MPERHLGDAFSMPKATGTTGHTDTNTIAEYWLANWWKPTFYMYEPLVIELKKIWPWLPVPTSFTPSE
jgi:hypothetical protein